MVGDQMRYLLILAACVVITAPLEFFGGNVYRRPVRLMKSVFPVATVFLAWDVVAVAGRVWTFNPRYVSGPEVLFHLPFEELLFFVVIPICALLTYGCVETLLAASRRARRCTARKEPTP